MFRLLTVLSAFLGFFLGVCVAICLAAQVGAPECSPGVKGAAILNLVCLMVIFALSWHWDKLHEGI